MTVLVPLLIVVYKQLIDTYIPGLGVGAQEGRPAPLHHAALWLLASRPLEHQVDTVLKHWVTTALKVTPSPTDFRSAWPTDSQQTPGSGRGGGRQGTYPLVRIRWYTQPPQRLYQRRRYWHRVLYEIIHSSLIVDSIFFKMFNLMLVSFQIILPFEHH